LKIERAGSVAIMGVEEKWVHLTVTERFGRHFDSPLHGKERVFVTNFFNLCNNVSSNLLSFCTFVISCCTVSFFITKRQSSLVQFHEHIAVGH